MTAQMGDIYRYKEEEYKLVFRTARTFQPDKFGFSPTWWKTSCWDGFWCRYEITDGRLLLRDLKILDENGNYPEINGVACDPLNVPKTGGTLSDLKYDPAAVSYHYPGRRPRDYHDIGLFLPYTGQVLAGAGHVGGYYIHLGYQRPQSYKKLIELNFQDGILIEVIDHSRVAEHLREEITKRREEGDWGFFLELELYEQMPEEDREPLRWFWDRTERKP